LPSLVLTVERRYGKGEGEGVRVRLRVSTEAEASTAPQTDPLNSHEHPKARILRTRPSCQSPLWFKEGASANVVPSSYFALPCRFLTENADVWSQNAWDHVPPPADQDAIIAASLARQRAAPVPEGDKHKYNTKPAKHWFVSVQTPVGVMFL
jgi:hypothetical protein